MQCHYTNVCTTEDKHTISVTAYDLTECDQNSSCSEDLGKIIALLLRRKLPSLSVHSGLKEVGEVGERDE